MNTPQIDANAQNLGTNPGHKRVTGLSGNEIFCLDKLGLKSGQLCIGNSVVALGLTQGLGAGLSTLAGGEVSKSPT